MLHRVRQVLGTLSRAEKRVAVWLLEHPAAVPALPLATLARQAGVSEPTVVRFCRSVGCSGFSDFKLRVTRYLATHVEGLHAAVSASDETATIAHKVIGASVRELQRVQQTLDTTMLQVIAARVAAARRILFIGVGASALVAQDAHNKFFRLGLACAAFCDGPSIAQAASVSDMHTVVIAISKTGESADIIDALIRARGTGATSVAITTPGSRLAKAAELALLVDVDEDTAIYTPMSSRLAQLAVLDVLQVCTAIVGGETALAHLQASKAALQHGFTSAAGRSARRQ